MNFSLSFLTADIALIPLRKHNIHLRVFQRLFHETWVCSSIFYRHRIVLVFLKSSVLLDPELTIFCKCFLDMRLLHGIRRKALKIHGKSLFCPFVIPFWDLWENITFTFLSFPRLARQLEIILGLFVTLGVTSTTALRISKFLACFIISMIPQVKIFKFVTVYLNYFHLLLDVEHLSQTDSYEMLKNVTYLMKVSFQPLIFLKASVSWYW